MSSDRKVFIIFLDVIDIKIEKGNTVEKRMFFLALLGHFILRKSNKKKTIMKT